MGFACQGPAQLGSRRNGESFTYQGPKLSEAPMPESVSFSQVQELSGALVRLVGIAAPGIVAVHSNRSRSSGFFWRPGLIVTADEALSEEGEIIVTLPGGEPIAAQLVGRDHTTDVALLRVDRSDVPPLQLESPPVAVGALAIVVGGT
jgi:S1-C subfamily serine protease